MFSLGYEFRHIAIFSHLTDHYPFELLLDASNNLKCQAWPAGPVRSRRDVYLH